VQVTPAIEAILRAAPWWRGYDASPPPRGGGPYYTLLLLKRGLSTPPGFDRKGFENSCQGRDILCGLLNLGSGIRLMAATSHLESYLSAEQTSSTERVAQMHEALAGLESTRQPNAIFVGDTNWDDVMDGDLSAQLPPRWADAWRALRPGEPGFTYDAVANGMLMGRLQKRLDRVVFKLTDYEAAGVRMVGTRALPGVTYAKQFHNGGSKQLPVLPSDHFGLLFTMRRVTRRGATTGA
jgi:tyrosyl-DNA phosphodiesterase 2